MIVSGDREQTMDIINAMNPVVFDVLPLTLEEVFTYEMEALGYTFDAVSYTHLIREACNNNDVKKIILELDYQYWNKNLKRDSDFGDLLVYGQLPFTSLKMEYIVSQLMDKDFRTIYFRRYAFAKNWKTAKKYMAIKKTDEYKKDVYKRQHLKNILTDILLKTKWYLHRQMIIIHIQLKMCIRDRYYG